MFNKIFNSHHYLGRRKKGYFEGWYFRQDGSFPFSIIVGVSKGSDSHAFVQYIDSVESRYFRYDLADFSYNKSDMLIKLADNQFSLSGLEVNLKDGDWTFYSKLTFNNMTRFRSSLLCPSAMGVFSYLPMSCNHAVISMLHFTSGIAKLGGEEIEINGRGYIEKDFGTSFPENYFWTHVSNSQTSVMFALAWPLIFNIKGHICLLTHKGKQYNLSYYTSAKLVSHSLSHSDASFTIVKGKTRLEFSAKTNEHAQKLLAPTLNGSMSRTILENLKADLQVKLTLNGELIDTSDLTVGCYEFGEN